MNLNQIFTKVEYYFKVEYLESFSLKNKKKFVATFSALRKKNNNKKIYQNKIILLNSTCSISTKCHNQVVSLYHIVPTDSACINQLCYRIRNKRRTKKKQVDFRTDVATWSCPDHIFLFLCFLHTLLRNINI